MKKLGSNILKSRDVNFEGSFTVGLLNSGAAAVNTSAPNANVEPQVSVVDSQPEFAVIEVTCSCGTKTRVKCNYAEMQAEAQPASQTETVGENKNES